MITNTHLLILQHLALSTTAFVIARREDPGKTVSMHDRKAVGILAIVASDNHCDSVFLAKGFRDLKPAFLNLLLSFCDANQHETLHCQNRANTKCLFIFML